MVCEHAALQLDFGTLFNCALSSKVLVEPSLRWLYRCHTESEYFKNESTDTEGPKNHNLTYLDRVAAEQQSISRLALLWRSIIRSSIQGSTAYPYCLYIRTLDFRNLSDLLEDPKFRDVCLDTFFADDMSGFLSVKDTPLKRSTRARATRIHVPTVLDLVGESITSFAHRNSAAVALEDLSGQISASSLLTWVGRLSRLTSLTVWDGTVLNESVALEIAEHCPNFDDLTFMTCVQDETDQSLASFFSKLRPNSLKSFTVIASNTLGHESLFALNNHSKSLKSLKLGSLRSQGIRNLASLKGCEALETLEIEDAEGLINLEATENDVFLEVVGWLGQCEQLKSLQLVKIVSAPEILTHLLTRNNIRLKRLGLVGYDLINKQHLHKAISHQTSLESLELKADADGVVRDDIDTLVSSISQLKKLKYLDILDTSEYFHGSEIKDLASKLPDLEYFSFAGYDVSDDIWPSISCLHHLRELAIHAISSFTLNGLRNYISSLHHTNHGLLLSVLSQARENDLSEDEKSIIRQTIEAKVDGKFEFVLFRDVESDFETFSD
ncbi:hypothetical protein B7494_g6046 [Chlorociboria aeruginascens]|nr:hypothetical protein B7494_g6046 [Chlorociboria aeruginascens]